MAPIKQIDVHQVKQLEDKDSATIVDIRDPTSFNAGHIPNAIHLSDGTVEQFIIDTDKNKPLVVFSEKGFKEVSSMIGGFEGWLSAFPNSTRKA